MYILADEVQTLVSFYLLHKMLWCVGIIFLIDFSKYLRLGIRYIWHKQVGLLFIEPPCIIMVFYKSEFIEKVIATPYSKNQWSDIRLGDASLIFFSVYIVVD